MWIADKHRGVHDDSKKEQVPPKTIHISIEHLLHTLKQLTKSLLGAMGSFAGSGQSEESRCGHAPFGQCEHDEGDEGRRPGKRETVSRFYPFLYPALRISAPLFCPTLLSLARHQPTYSHPYKHTHTQHTLIHISPLPEDPMKLASSYTHTMQKDPIQLPSPILGAGAKAGAVDVAAAARRLSGGGAAGNSLSIPSIEPQSAEAFRRRSLCSIDQPGVVMTKLPQGKKNNNPSLLMDSWHLLLLKEVMHCFSLGARSIYLWTPLLTVARFFIWGR